MGTLGAMQDFPLRIMRLMDHAEREHGSREIVAARADGTTVRTNWKRGRRQLAAPGAGARAARRRARRARRDAGDEPRPAPRRLVRRGRHGRRSPHAQPAAVRRPADLHHQSRRGPGDPLRPRLRAARRAAEAAADRHPAFHLLRRRVRRAARRRGRRLSLVRRRRARAVRPLLHQRHDRATPRACSTSIARPCSTR